MKRNHAGRLKTLYRIKREVQAMLGERKEQTEAKRTRGARTRDHVGYAGQVRARRATQYSTFALHNKEDSRQ